MNRPLLRRLGILALAAACQPLWAGEATTLTPEAWRALLLLSGSVTEDCYWSETWTSTERVSISPA